MAKTIIEQSARNSMYVLKLNNLEWDNFNTLFKLIVQLNYYTQSDKRDDLKIRKFIDEGYHYCQLLKPTIDKVQRFSHPCKILVFNKTNWTTLNEYFITTCAMADLLKQCQGAGDRPSASMIEVYLQRFQVLEEKLYRIMETVI
jgi:hypothetical protein